MILEAIKLNLNWRIQSINSNRCERFPKIFKEERFNLIILDVMLPEIDGFQVAETIRLENSRCQSCS